MNEVIFIIVIVVIVIFSIVFMTIKERHKSQQMIQRRWNQDPSSYYEPNERNLIESSHYLFTLLEKEGNINHATWQDLDLFDVYKKINLTYSKFGEDILYTSLKAIDINPSSSPLINEEWQLYLTNHMDERAKIQYRLNQLGKKIKTNSLYRYFLEDTSIKMVLSSSFIKLFASLPILSCILMIFSPVIGIGLFIASIFLMLFFI
ncbi:hypothetical protein [Vagococcus bubulae]|uniref:Uncharacterized protein n=1 Tax=Vagococcus bubulae TaxID=1977868 RepID=A0A429ZCI7_9ENTE|nr:hypothetical protein [Vagococcus bubulae]RST91417.1 hypothetical protein CBF36_10110 [Vagococcus bubulae]